jgi:hypothetical protein
MLIGLDGGVKAILFLALSATTLSACSDPNEFDLRCKATFVRRPGDNTPPPVVQNHFRFILDQKKYCEGDCNNLSDVEDIPETSNSKIVISRFRTPFSEYKSDIDRTDGTYRILEHYYDGLDEVFIGTCAHLPFSGFPKAAF